MVIELNVEQLRLRLRSISHREVAAIENPEVRYRVEAGSEKIDDINFCINEGARRLQGRCVRFLAASNVPFADNLLTLPESYTYELALSERRAMGKADSFAEAMNSFIIEYALSLFYSMMSQGDLSNAHSVRALSAGEQIDELLYSKQPPIV